MRTPCQILGISSSHQLHSSFEFLTADTVSKETSVLYVFYIESHYRPPFPLVNSKIEHYGKFVKAKFDFEVIWQGKKEKRKEKYCIILLSLRVTNRLSLIHNNEN